MASIRSLTEGQKQRGRGGDSYLHLKGIRPPRANKEPVPFLDTSPVSNPQGTMTILPRLSTWRFPESHPGPQMMNPAPPTRTHADTSTPAWHPSPHLPTHTHTHERARVRERAWLNSSLAPFFQAATQIHSNLPSHSWQRKHPKTLPKTEDKHVSQEADRGV